MTASRPLAICSMTATASRHSGTALKIGKMPVKGMEPRIAQAGLIHTVVRKLAAMKSSRARSMRSASPV